MLIHSYMEAHKHKKVGYLWVGGFWVIFLFAYSHVPVLLQKPGITTEEIKKAPGFHTGGPYQVEHSFS